jgi:hypothetical protein
MMEIIVEVPPEKSIPPVIEKPTPSVEVMSKPDFLNTDRVGGVLIPVEYGG